jgi:virulence-associated protein E
VGRGIARGYAAVWTYRRPYATLSPVKRLGVRRLLLHHVSSRRFSDQLPLGARAKEVIEQTAGKWIIEAAELHTRGTDVEHLKVFLSAQTDGPVRLAHSGRIRRIMERHGFKAKIRVWVRVWAEVDAGSAAKTVQVRKRPKGISVRTRAIFSGEVLVTTG